MTGQKVLTHLSSKTPPRGLECLRESAVSPVDWWSATSTANGGPMRLWACVPRPVDGCPAPRSTIPTRRPGITSQEPSCARSARKAISTSATGLGERARHLASHTVRLERIEKRVLVYFCRTLVQKIDLSGERPLDCL